MRSPQRRPTPPGRTTRRASLEHRDSIGALDEVVERTHHEDGVERFVGMGQLATVALLDDVGPSVTRLLDVQRDGIEQGDRVPAIREPRGVPPRAAADVEDSGRWRRQQPSEQLLGPQSFERPTREPLALGALLVVSDDLGVHRANGTGASARGVILFGRRSGHH